MRYVYILRCADETLYTWMTTDLDRRVSEHNGEWKGVKWAKYTKSRQPVELVWSSCAYTRNEAASEERRIKKFSKEKKKQLIASTF